MGLTEEQKERIIELAIKHKIDLKGNTYKISENTKRMLEMGYSFEDIHLKRINIFFINPFIPEDGIFLDKPNGKRLYENSSFYKLRLAEFIELLCAAMEAVAPIEISTTIKGVKKKKVELSSYDCENLYLFLNTELEKIQDGFYQFNFDWDFKKNIETRGKEGFTEPYTKDELAKILKYERELYKNQDRKSRDLNKRQIRILSHYFREEGVFNNKTKELASKEYQFLYDLLAVVGMFPKETIDRYSASMKKDALRDYIRNR